MAKDSTPLVEPIESIKEETKVTKHSGIPCWNCDGELDNDLICDKCGFDQKLVYNLDLEASKTKERE
jgi:hypothetical protein